MKWVTRERPKIDRIACPWLIARFIDEQPEFLYVPNDRVQAVAEETDAIPYDVPDVELSHVGDLCSFDAFLSKYHLDDPALHQLAPIRSRRRHIPAGSDAAVGGAVRHFPRPVRQLRGRP